MRGYGVFWIANGFDPDDDSQTDRFSRVCLDMAADRYRALKRECKGTDFVVKFPITKSVVRSSRGRVLWQTLLDEAAHYGNVPMEDIFPTEETSINALSDARAIALFARENMGMHIEVFATGREVARYFKATYAAVARHIVGYPDFRFSMSYPPNAPRSGFISRQKYNLGTAVTYLAAVHPKAFRLYYDLRHKTDASRRHKFVRSVK